jgi:protein SCO1/2
MPKWILVIIAVITALTIAMTLVALRQGAAPKGGPTELFETQSGPKAKIYTPSTGANVAVISTDPDTGERVFAPRAGIEGYAVPEFSLIDQDGTAVDHTVFDGKITILNFIFTNCLTACPPMTSNMVQIYKKLDGSPVQFLSISVDPVHDTPERLTEYAAKFGIDTDRWTFLTGPEGESARVVAESLKFEISEDPDGSAVIPLADGTTMANIRHPIKLFLIGPNREILDFCAHQVESDRERFAALAREATE